MPLRPIDMQVLLPKAIKIDKAKPAVVNQLDNALQSVQNEQEKERQKKLKSVNALDKKAEAKVRDKKEKDAHQNKKKKKKQTQHDGTYHLDIKV